MKSQLNCPEDLNPEAVENLLDVLLMAIIRGSTKDGEKDKDLHKRLTDAKRALFGITPSRGKPKDHDVPELLEMARRYIKRQGEPNIGPNYALSWDHEIDGIQTGLAREVLEEGIQTGASPKPYNFDEKIRNLQQKFDNNISTWLAIVAGQDGLLVDAFMGHLADIEALLNRLGFKVVRPADINRDLIR